MTRKSKFVDTAEVKRRTDEQIRNMEGYIIDRYCRDFNLNDKSTWNNEVKYIYKNTYSAIYASLRKETKLKKANFWLETMDNGNIKEYLSQFGIKVSPDGRIFFTNCGRKALEYLMQKVIFPELEKTFCLTGFEITKNASFMAQNILNCEKVELIENTESKGE